MPHFDFAHRLTLCGYKGEPQDFDYKISTTWWLDGYAKRYGTVEELLHHCMKAREFCDEVRRGTAIWIEDDEILLRLTNLRKNGFLHTSQPVDEPWVDYET